MIDFRPTLVQELRSLGLPVYYEVFLTQETEVPCISYMVATDIEQATGDTLGYSDLNIYVKIWAKTVAEIAEYSRKIDNKMRELGFTRTGTTELWQDGIGQNQLRYRGLAREYFDEGDNK